MRSKEPSPARKGVPKSGTPLETKQFQTWDGINTGFPPLPDPRNRPLSGKFQRTPDDLLHDLGCAAGRLLGGFFAPLPAEIRSRTSQCFPRNPNDSTYTTGQSRDLHHTHTGYCELAPKRFKPRQVLSVEYVPGPANPPRFRSSNPAVLRTLETDRSLPSDHSPRAPA